MKTIITNSIIITMNSDMEVFPDGYVKIEGTKILETGPSCDLKETTEELRAAGWQIKDGKRGILMPGMVNTCLLYTSPSPRD